MAATTKPSLWCVGEAQNKTVSDRAFLPLGGAKVDGCPAVELTCLFFHSPATNRCMF